MPDTPRPDDHALLDTSFIRAAPYIEPAAADRDRVRHVTGDQVLPAVRGMQYVLRRMRIGVGGPAAYAILVALIVVVAGAMLLLLGPGDAHAVTSLVRTRFGLPG